MNLEKDHELQMSFPDGFGSSTLIGLKIVEIYDDEVDRGKTGAGPPGTFRQLQLLINPQALQSQLHPVFTDFVTSIQIVIEGVDRSLENFDVVTKSFKGKEDIELVMEELNRLLEKDFADLLIFSSIVSLVDNQLANLADVTSVLGLFAIILNGVALLLIINVQSMAVDDRKNQTAVLRALGSSVSTIFFVFLVEATIVGLVGAIVGLGIGYLISVWILGILSGVFQVTLLGSGLSVGLMFTAVFTGLLLSIITAVAPAFGAARSGIANALRGIPDVKKPRKGYFTLIIGIVLFIFGLNIARSIGDLGSDATWENLDDQITILLGFGLTLAGLGMLLTLAISRRLALSISGLSLFGLGVIFFVFTLELGKTGNGGNLFSVILLFMITGSTILVSVNYTDIMNGVGRILFAITGIRAISQVTTKQMIGKKNRGVLVYTILAVILVLVIFIASSAETQRVAVVGRYSGLSDGIDVVVTTDNAIDGVEERIESLNDRSIEGLDDFGTVTHVFAFKQKFMPLYLVSPEDDNFDISTDIVGIPVIPVEQNTLNPDNWGEDSLHIPFADLDESVEAEAGVAVNLQTSEEDQKEIRKAVFELFFRDFQRSQPVELTVDGETRGFDEHQYFAIGGFFLGFLHLDLLTGKTIYLQAANGSIIPLYLGGSTFFDMLGNSDFPLYSNALIVPPAVASRLAFDDYENTFLVRSTNEYDDTDRNEKLAMAIEKDLNNLQEGADSLSNNQDPVILVGAATTIVFDQVQGFYFEQAAFWDFLGAFSTLGLVIGALGMMIIAVRSVSERTREIGMMRSIGFSRSSVVYGVLIEMVVLSLLSLIVGGFIAVIFSENFADSIYGVKALYPVGQILGYVFGLLGLAILSGVIPGYNASKVTPSEALRYTG
ncbi:MAG: FtsX-like permease family protein [Candidatus Heimdallarchaeota archaeon]|nr:FtsX-like permease family protein [Candidatus Heimdallarchaeota archaeon]